MFKTQGEVNEILSALGQQLTEISKEPIDLLICGGSALNALGLITRATKDVDVLAIVSLGANFGLTLHTAKPLPLNLVQAAKKVARDFKLPEDWINPGPTSALDFGLPVGVLDRALVKDYGASLKVRFLSRYDQIHFKLYAATDQGGKHYEDLLALKPTADELEKAALWSMTHDVSEGYKYNLTRLLITMDHQNVAERI